MSAVSAVLKEAAGISPAAYKELQALLHDRGTLEPRAVVAAARDPASALHKYFEWDADIAHERYLVQQARMLLTRVTVILPNDAGREYRVRAYVSLRGDRGDGGYRSLQQVRTNNAAYLQLLEQARRDAESFTKRYESLRETAPLRRAIAQWLAASK